MHLNNEQHKKVNSSHLKRNAYLYVRQSTIRQVFENQESTKRQYALRERAVALGWSIENVIVIDSDLGQSGASAADREGFQKLVTEVGLGRAGIVMGLEVSRLARNSSDWHRLVEICALTQTLILDEDGIYEPSHFNDRLLLGLKGTMSEAELHVLKARLQGGILNKAKRGELQSPVPIGFVYNSDGKVILDPDQQIRRSIQVFFATFTRTGSATATVKSFRDNGLKFPRRPKHGPHKGEVLWSELMHSRTLQILHNPRYAGAFFYGRTRPIRLPSGQIKHTKIPRQEWTSLHHNAHEGYLSWEQFEQNLKQLKTNAQTFGSDRRRSPPREGPALLQGLVLCGFCGERMTIRYHSRKGKQVPDYVCQKQGIEEAHMPCQRIPGMAIDQKIGELMIEAMSPLALEVALKVQTELENRHDESEHLRKQHIQRARYDADLARRRFMQVDPDNRLVADTLEAEWNSKLKLLSDAQAECEEQSKKLQQSLSAEEQAKIQQLATDFPKLWEDIHTPDREKKRMVRLMLEDVTLTRNNGILLQIRFKGGLTKSIQLAAPLPAWALRKTAADVVKEIDRLLDSNNYGEVANLLNKSGKVTGTGQAFDAKSIRFIQWSYRLKSRYDRLRAQGLLRTHELANTLGVHHSTIRKWTSRRILKAHASTEKGESFYELPGPALCKKLFKIKSQGRSRVFIETVTQRLKRGAV